MTATSDVAAALPALRNRRFDEIALGDSVELERTLSRDDFVWLAAQFGGLDPGKLDAAALPTLEGSFARALWGGALIAATLGTRLPGPGTICLEQRLRFVAPLAVGDRLRVTLTVTARDEVTRHVTLACRACKADGGAAIEGEVVVQAPDATLALEQARLPDIRAETADRGGLERLLAHVRPLGRIRMAVVHPCNALSLSAALEARDAGLIEPVLVAPRAKLEAVAAEAGLDLGGLAIEDVPHSDAAAERAATLAGCGEVEALMKGSLHTDELMSAVLAPQANLRTKRRVSHCFLMQTPAYPRPFIITDAAINIAPDLEQKADIVRNAIELAQAIGVERPNVAILAAVETVSPSMPATLDAAALCKMAERGQISGAVLDGPLAFDNAVSAAAAQIKGIASPVAGRADILVVPDLESGNMLAKQLEYLGQAASAGIVLGARVPIVLTSRADPRDSRIAACALAVLLAHRYRTSPP